ncbi:MAG: hypothetical protein LBP38_06180 [Desulfovibrio sp.]|jgi:hypothetical protein|nr:hypothetical protein [Desulfovibrio sp.]
MAETQGNYSAFLDVLCAAAARAGMLERDARSALYADNDAGRYRALMEQRAQSLIDLESRTADLLDALPEVERRQTRSALRSFADGARTALELGSVFYMSALLYRDNHKAGEPDKLQALVEDLETRLR